MEGVGAASIDDRCHLGGGSTKVMPMEVDVDGPKKKDEGEGLRCLKLWF